VDFIPNTIRELYEVKEWRNASVVLGGKHEEEWANLLEVLLSFRLKRNYVVKGGGGRSDVPKVIDGHLGRLGWKKKSFDIKVTVDGDSYDLPTHEVDMFKGRVAIEVEWNNKTEFYDRDLNNFRLLFDLRVIDVGVVITRADELKSVLSSLGIWHKYGASSTNASKLYYKVDGGGGGGCPLLVFAITKALYVLDD
jgi:hypothetical protein